MKLLFLHGAIKNCGDFLIAHRSRLLIQSLVPECEIISYWEGTDFSKKENYAVLSECDGIVFGGGPFFTNNIYPNDIPLIPDIKALSKPMINIGGGWYGRDNKYTTIKNYPLNSESLELLRKIENSTGELSCRDWFTVNMLQEKGFKAVMNGCPAWYDLNYINRTDFQPPKSINRICVSDPANSKNSKSAVELLNWLKTRFPQAAVVLVYHRGINKNTDLYKYAHKENIEIVDISGGHEGFKIYDECQLHIGYRVHSHIYNMSHRNFSILIEEDGRGAGVNNALGLESIKAYRELSFDQPVLKKFEYKFAYKQNPSMVDELEALIIKTYATSGLEYRQAFEKMQFYYSKMKQHIETIKKW